MQKPNKTMLSAFLVIATTMVALGLGEAVVRAKNADMRNYDVEMWRYARELKVTSSNPVLGHEHIPGQRATLQSVEIRINEMGLRGGPVPTGKPGQRRILFLGSSVTLGWGVTEQETLSVVSQRMLQERGIDAVTLNAGIGNYNSVRYVERYLSRLAGLQPTDIVVQYFIRDAEVLEAGGGNPLLRNSQLALLLWSTVNRKLDAGKPLADHYRQVYREDGQGFLAMRDALARLSEAVRTQGIRLHLVLTPDFHNLVEYPYGDIHARMGALGRSLGYRVTDLLPALAGIPREEIWAMPGDPHPNARGHLIMADKVASALVAD